MPSVSGKQHRAMEAAAHGAGKIGIPQSVGEDFAQADKGKKFGKTTASAAAAAIARRGKKAPLPESEGC